MGRSTNILLFFAASICFSHIHQGHLAGDAVRYAHIASSILLRNDWFSLYDGFQNIEGYANKPHLLFWLLALCFKYLGYSTFVAKLPAALFVFLSLLLFWHIAQRLHQSKVALILLGLFVCTRVFMRDILDLNVEGISLLGALLCLFGSLPSDAFKNSEKSLRRLAILFGVLLILQSKTPFIVLFLWPLFVHQLLRKNPARGLSKRTLLRLLTFGFLVLVGGMLYAPTEYLRVVVDNQWINPIRENDRFFYNIFEWLGAVLFSWAPLSWLGIAGVGTLLKRVRGERTLRCLSDTDVFLLLWSSSLIPIMLSVDCRPRYALFPMLGIALLAGYPLRRLVTRFGGERLTLRHLENLAGFAAILCLLLFAVFDIQIHRSDPNILAAQQLPNEYSGEEYSVCLLRDTIPRGRRTAKFAELLLNLELSSVPNQKTPFVYNPDTLPPAMRSRNLLLLADEGCLRTLRNEGMELKDSGEFF